MTAGDAQVHAYLVSIVRKLRVLVDCSGRPLQYDVAGTGLGSPLRKGYRLKFFLPALVMRTAGWMLKGTLSNPVVVDHLEHNCMPERRLHSRGGAMVCVRDETPDTTADELYFDGTPRCGRMTFL